LLIDLLTPHLPYQGKPLLTLHGLKFIIFFALAGATLWLGIRFERYRPVGIELLNNSSFSENPDLWQMAGPPGSAVVEYPGILHLQSTDAT
jgi:hypothetical protein